MLSKLNPAQQAAARHLDGPLLVLAGAGSGKTRVITHKIAWLVAECGHDPRNIAAITFTNKAAREMQDRISDLLPNGAGKGLTVCTFHALGVRILRAEAAHLGLKPGFSILDATDTQGILTDLAGTVDRATVRQLQWRISAWKNAFIDADQALAEAKDESEAHSARIFRDYDATLRAYQAVDFDDLIRLPVALFESEPAVLDRWQNRLRYLLVDEYQDTNACQYRLLRLLAGPMARFTAVGDDDQAIYAWRGADKENLNALQRDFPRLEVIKLEQNYRSTVRILKAANTLIAHNPKLFEKKLWSEFGHGEPIRINAMRDPDHEAEAVIMRLLAHKFEQRARFSDYAILYRSNHQARIFEQQLRNQRVPYVLSGGQSFFDKAEIKDITAYLRLLLNPNDDPAFIRAVTTPRRGIGSQTLEALGRYAGLRQCSLHAAAGESGLSAHVAERQLEPLGRFIDFLDRLRTRAGQEAAGPVLHDLLTAIDYEGWLYDSEEGRAAETRWKNVCDFRDWLARKSEEDQTGLLELTQTIALMNLLDKREGSAPDAVQLSTLHAAKGLEFKHVFLVGVEDGLLPHRESMRGDKLEEERRLMYVGITRAERTLFVSHCRKRRAGGEWVPCEPSRFIEEMGREDLVFSGDKPAAETDTPEKRAARTARLNEIKAMLTGRG